MPSSSSSSDALPTTAEKALHHEDEDVTECNIVLLTSQTTDACLDWVIFPALLFIQFGATMYCQLKEGVELEVNWNEVHLTVFAFCLVAGLYRQVMRRHSRCCSPLGRLFFLLLPELFTNVLLAMVMFSSLAYAYVALVVLTLALSCVGIAAGLDLLWNLPVIDLDEEEDYYVALIETDEEEGEEDIFVC